MNLKRAKALRRAAREERERLRRAGALVSRDLAHFAALVSGNRWLIRDPRPGRERTAVNDPRTPRGVYLRLKKEDR